MNQKKAKRIRKQCYGDDAPTDRKHYRHKGTGEIIADEKRHRFQVAKKLSNENAYDPDEKGKKKARKMVARKKKNHEKWEKRKANREKQNGTI